MLHRVANSAKSRAERPGPARGPLRRAAAAWAMLFAACAGSSVEPFRPGALDAAQLELCRATEQAYRRGADDYEALRASAAADPTTAAWLVRMFVRDVFTVREGRTLGKDEELLRAAAKIEDPVESRATAEIVRMGAVAVPTLVGDLLCHSQPQPRELGIELLARVGAPAVPAVVELAQHGDTRQRRAAGRALGAIGTAGDVLPALRQLLADGDYTVRADALRDLHDGGAPVRALLIDRLRADADPFVRRTAAQSLAHFRDRVAATALIDYLERCKTDRDYRGEEAAQDSLQTLAGSHGPRTPAAWRAFAQTLTDSD